MYMELDYNRFTAQG